MICESSICGFGMDIWFTPREEIIKCHFSAELKKKIDPTNTSAFLPIFKNQIELERKFIETLEISIDFGSIKKYVTCDVSVIFLLFGASLISPLSTCGSNMETYWNMDF